MALITLSLSAAISILLGVLILIFPKSLNLAVALWLILYGVLQLLSNYNFLY